MKKIKNIALAALAVVVIGYGAAHASFPVKTDSKKNSSTEQVSSTNSQNSSDKSTSVSASEVTKVSVKKESNSSKPMDNEKLITLLLWFFLWGLAAHRWYRGKPVGWNVLFILTAGGCGVWAIVDLVNILTDKF